MKLHRAGQSKPARRAYERILRNEPDNPDALHYYGVLIHSEGQSGKAVKFIERAIELEPGYASAWQNLGNVYQESGQAEKAESCYRRAIELDPDLPEAWSNLCIILKQKRELDEALAAGNRAAGLAPGNKLAWYSLANAMKAAGRLEEAVDAYQKAIDLDPGFMLAHDAVCRTTHMIESRKGLAGAEMTRTRAAYQRWLEADPESSVSRYMIAALNQDPDLERAPDEYVVGLFDAFAQSFDSNLARLDYRVPALVSQAITDVFPDPKADLDVLDAGCGTGLLAAALRPWSRRLAGVDLSPGMLSRARARRLYDDLAEAELGAWLAETRETFDLVVCADTLCYFGELETVIRGLSGVMRPGATCVFSVERNTMNSSPYLLNPHGRFSHRGGYVRSCLEQAGLAVLGFEAEVLRQEGGRDVDGFLVVARK